MPRQKKIGKKRLARVSVEGQLRQEIDWDKHAWVLLQYARILSESDEAPTP